MPSGAKGLGLDADPETYFRPYPMNPNSSMAPPAITVTPEMEPTSTHGRVMSWKPNPRLEVMNSTPSAKGICTVPPISPLPERARKPSPTPTSPRLLPCPRLKLYVAVTFKFVFPSKMPSSMAFSRSKLTSIEWPDFKKPLTSILGSRTASPPAVALARPLTLAPPPGSPRPVPFPYPRSA